MRIEVTQDLIDKGEAKDCSSCPVALAILVATGAQAVEVYATGGFLATRRRGTEFVMPVEARQFIVDFDAGKRVAPFSFDLDLPA